MNNEAWGCCVYHGAFLASMSHCCTVDVYGGSTTVQISWECTQITPGKSINHDSAIQVSPGSQTLMSRSYYRSGMLKQPGWYHKFRQRLTMLATKLQQKPRGILIFGKIWHSISNNSCPLSIISWISTKLTEQQHCWPETINTSIHTSWSSRDSQKTL
ncbi:hypothetical protein AWENTII_006656 [Aspergillus wentii]